jgi:hypothetical protein
MREVKFVNKKKLSIVCLLLSINFVVNSEEGKKIGELIEVDVYRSSSCSCCGKWVEHLKENQFQVKDHIVDDVQVMKDKYGVSAEMASCHTAVVNGYVVEGHVPAADIKRLLKLKPAVVGISVPGMPVGTPGMEVGSKKDDYDVVSFDKSKSVQIFNQYKGN